MQEKPFVHPVHTLEIDHSHAHQITRYASAFMRSCRYLRLVFIEALDFQETVQRQCFGQCRHRRQQLRPASSLLAAIGILKPAPRQHRPRHLVESVHHIGQRIWREQAIRVQ